jgi:uncharacterized hydrophobic protein (TIGR00271 family)
VIPAIGEEAKTANIELKANSDDDPLTDEQATALCALLDQELTPEGWVATARESSIDPDSEDQDQTEAPVGISLISVPAKRVVSTVLPLVAEKGEGLLLTVVDEVPREPTVWTEINRKLLQLTACQYACVVPGQREADGEILFKPSHAQYKSTVTPLALALATLRERRVTALWVEPDIGAESERVGRKMLDRELRSALGADATNVGRRIEVQDPPLRGILQACADERYEVFIMAVERPIGDAFADGQLAVRIARGTDQPTLIFTRDAIPIRTRLQRFLGSSLRRIVPQLQREERTDFVDRVQSSSAWNFDFVALMGLATAIATFGLVGNSPAVIIGAMLVAPLMTPLMGIGLSIVQGNLRLATMTSRTAFLGFLLAFVIALAIGALNPEFGIPTAEMYGRQWPNLVDVAIAFVAGLAAAYASGRPGLLAALPGVAIAASLVPPIAVSGLAASIGQYDLAIGSMLLFAVNVVAIVFASSLVLWGVGFQRRGEFSLKARILASGVTTIAIATGLGVAVAPPMVAPPRELVEEIESVLGDRNRMRHVRLKREDGRALVQIDLGGAIDDHPNFGSQLLVIVRKHLGNNANVRLTYRHETILE